MGGTIITETGVGVVLMEGAAAGTSPLMPEIRRRDHDGNVQRVGGMPLYLNPKPDDVNMEFDLNQNQLKRLPQFGGVSVP